MQNSLACRATKATNQDFNFDNEVKDVFAEPFPESEERILDDLATTQLAIIGRNFEIETYEKTGIVL